MKYFIKNENDVDALLLGLSFMGTGGGGTIEMGKAMLMEVLEAGKDIKLVSIDELSDDAQTICAYMMGSSGPMTEEKRRLMSSYGLTDIKVNNMQAAAIKLLEKFSDVSIDAVMPLELGAAATSGAISSSAWLGLPVIDADYMGRALPEISQTLPVIHDQSMYPLASVDRYQNEVIISHASSDQMGERLGKSVAAASLDLVGQAAFLLKANIVKRMSLHGTLSSSFALGKVMLQAQKEGTNVIDAILTHFDGKAKVLFKGEITKLESYEKEGYFYGENHINGTDEFAGDHYRIWFKNENIQAWLNEQVDVSSPDLISIVDATTGKPLLNGRITENQKVVVIGLRADQRLQTRQALNKLGPKHYGFDFDYQPLEP